MKKRILMLLCTAVLALSITAPPALAAGGPFYPISVEEYTYGSFDELRINKVYQLSLSDDPSGIPTEDFERNGRRYFLLDMIKEDEVGVDTQNYTDTITQDSDTNDLSVVLKQLDPHREVTTEDGYTGLLALDYTSVTVEAKGYKTSTKSLSATRTYPNLSDADLSLIPKTTTDNGKTLTLGAVEWSGGENGYYTATATYTGTSSTRYATATRSRPLIPAKWQRPAAMLSPIPPSSAARNCPRRKRRMNPPPPPIRLARSSRKPLTQIPPPLKRAVWAGSPCWAVLAVWRRWRRRYFGPSRK